MALHRVWGRERRDSLNELHPLLRDRLLALDEPVARNDWAAVVRRSRMLRLSSRRARVVGVVAASVASLCVAGAMLGVALTSVGSSSDAVDPVRLAVRLSDGSGLVLYSRVQRQQFVDNTDDRLRGRLSVPLENPVPAATAAIEQTLTTTGPFRVAKASFRLPSSPGETISSPLPGDRALFAFNLYTSVGLERRAGSAVLTCQYSFDRNAFCNAAFDLEDGSRLIASGVLSPDATSFTLVVTGGHGRLGGPKGVLRETQV